jgi:lysyl-tRNA synthetase class 2
VGGLEDGAREASRVDEVRSPRQATVLSPSDVARVADGHTVLVGGRVEPRGERWTITDAFAELALPAELEGLVPSALAVFRCEIERAAILRAERVELEVPTPSAPRRETSRFRDRGLAARLRERRRGLSAVREYFDESGFLEVETPSMVVCPGLDLHLDAFAVTAPPERYLITSPEYQMKRLLVGGIPRVYQLARSFRRGELGARHTPEFLMLEWYRAFADVDEVVLDTEALVEHVVTELRGTTRVVVDGRAVDFARPWPRWTVAEAFERIAGVDESTMLDWAERDEDRFFRTLIDTVEPRLATLSTPVVLTRYPAPMASLARLCPDDPRYAERFEAYAAGVELCNGFGELTCPVEQRARFERDRRDRHARGLPAYPLDEPFLAALAEGMPRASGNALGVDRLLALASGTTDIHGVQAFPPEELEP